MAVAVKIPDLNVVDIDTHNIVPQVNPGMAGVAILTAGNREGLQTYTAPYEVAKDYDTTSYVYKFANIYFSAPGTTTLQVITYNPDDVNNGDDDNKISSALASLKSNLNSLKSNPSSWDNEKTNKATSNLFNTGNKAINSVLSSLEKDLSDHNDIDNDVTSLDSVISGYVASNPSVSGDPAVSALVKYYDCGAEYFMFLVNNDNKNTAIDLSNEVEGQSEHNLILDIPTSNSEPDFSWLDPIKNNQDTTLLSLPYTGDPSDYQFAASVLAQRAPEPPSANLQFTHDLKGIDPQDKYNFTPQDLDTYYKPFGVITYCYRNEIPMLSSGNSADGYQMSNVVTRDYLNMRISDGVTKLLVGAHDAGADIHYDQAGINQIQAEIKMILNDAEQKGYIASFTQKNVNANNISESNKESGDLTGLGYTWTPMNNINHVEFQQGIVLPEL